MSKGKAILSKKKSTRPLIIETDHTINKPSIAKIVEENAKKKPAQTAFIYLNNDLQEEQIVSNAELYQAMLVCMNNLKENNLSNKTVVLMYQNNIDFIIAFLACIALNVIAVPAYPPKSKQHSGRIRSILSNSQASTICTTTKIKNLMAHKKQSSSIDQNIQWLATDSFSYQAETKNKKFHNKKNSIAFLQYTSGSTSDPKGVMVSNENILHNCHEIKELFKINHASVSMSWAPNFHDMGLIYGILTPIYCCIPSIIMEPSTFIQNPLSWLKIIDKYKVTHSGAPNFAYELCSTKARAEKKLQLDLSSWKVAFNGSEPIKASSINSFTNTFKAYNFNKKSHTPCYGLAETTLLVSGKDVAENPVIETVLSHELEQNKVIFTAKHTKKSKTLIGNGKEKSNTVIKIVNPKTKEELQSNEIGEIWVSSPSVTIGYWNNKEKTNLVYNQKLKHNQQLSFLNTGDLGFKRHDGELFVTGRKKDVIIINGKNIYPQDIEEKIECSSPQIKREGTIAFEIEESNKKKIKIISEIERTALKNIDGDQLESDLTSLIQSEFNLPICSICFVKPMSLPKTSSGKKQRQKTKYLFKKGELTKIQPIKKSKAKANRSINKIPLTETEKVLIKIINSSLNSRINNSQTNIHSIGINSVNTIEIMSSIEESFGITFLPSELHDKNETIANLAKEIERKQELILAQTSIEDLTNIMSQAKENIYA